LTKAWKESMDLIGKTVEWEASGRGRGTTLRGEVVMLVPPGITNKDALDQLKLQRPELIIRPKYIRFSPSTYRTNRVLVLIEQKTKRKTNQVYWFYAPNTAELSVV